jgi:hypothetical protein
MGHIMGDCLVRLLVRKMGLWPDIWVAESIEEWVSE